MALLACAEKVVRDGGSDQEVYQAIRNTFHSEIACKYKKTADEEKESAGRPDNRVKHITNLLPPSFRPRTFLDLGCAEGMKPGRTWIYVTIFYTLQHQNPCDKTFQVL